MGDNHLPAVPDRAPSLLSLPESLTRQFYTWEQRGRGWDLWPESVELEPPFRPFSYTLPQRPVIDDGRHPGLWQRIAGWFGGGPQPAVAPDIQYAPEAMPRVLSDTERPELVELHVLLPDDLRISHGLSQQFLNNLTYCQNSVAFEIAGNAEEVRVQFTCAEHDAGQVTRQLDAHFPEAVIATPESSLAVQWFPSQNAFAYVVDFGLSEEFCRPLRTVPVFEPDPLIGLTAVLGDLREDEFAMFQVLFQPVRFPWAESLMRAIVLADGTHFFADAPDMVHLAKRKLGSPLYAAVIRVAAQSPRRERVSEIVQALGGALTTLDDPASNTLIALDDTDYPADSHVVDLVVRQSRRSGMLLNADELLSLAHLPSMSVRTPRLARLSKRTKGVPEVATGHACVLGENVHNGVIKEASLDMDRRMRHMHLVGASGTGKSTLLLNLIAQDMEVGHGLAVLDPHGDLIDDILARVPDHRLNDVVLLDPADADHPMGLNILSAHSELEKTLLASDFVSVFRRLSTSWGDQMTTVLANAVLALLESPEGGTLLDLRRFLVEKDFRNKYLRTVADPEVVYYWQREFPLLTGKPQGPILTRLDAFLRPKPIRYMVAQKENRLDFARFMDGGTIFLAKLAQGAIGEENAYLLGSFLVSKLQQMALARQEQAAEARRPFLLYIDEFHHFITPSMAALLTGARKYRLGLVLAHQELRQLEKRDAEVAGAVLANPCTRVCFRVGDEDARKLGEGFSFFEAEDLRNLAVGEAICRVERADWDFTLRTHPAPEVEETVADARRQAIREHTRANYAVPRQAVEAMLAEAAKVAQPPELEPKKRKKLEPAPAAATPAAPPEQLKPENVSQPADVEPAPAPQSKTDPPAPPPKPRTSTATSSPPLMGRGGPKHRSMQQSIKRFAEGLGYRATIEKTLPDGSSVDVLLEKEDRAIACEITVTSTTAYEMESVRKALTAGFGHVCVVSDEPKRISVLQDAVRTGLDEHDQARVHCLTQDGLVKFVLALEAEAAGRQETVRGYKVNVNYQPPEPGERESRKRAVSRIVVKALGRLRGKER